MFLNINRIHSTLWKMQTHLLSLPCNVQSTNLWVVSQIAVRVCSPCPWMDTKQSSLNQLHLKSTEQLETGKQ